MPNDLLTTAVTALQAEVATLRADLTAARQGKAQRPRMSSRRDARKQPSASALGQRNQRNKSRRDDRHGRLCRPYGTRPLLHPGPALKCRAMAGRPGGTSTTTKKFRYLESRQIRTPNAEIRKKSEIRSRGALRISVFGNLSVFGFRISGLKDVSKLVCRCTSPTSATGAVG